MHGDVRERRITQRTEDGDHERLAHCIAHPQRGRAANLATESRVYGTPLVALCGKRWVRSRDPKRYPLCPECDEIRATLLTR